MTLLLKAEIAALFTLALPVPLAAAQSCAGSGNASPGELHRQVMLQGWQHEPGDPQFSFRNKLGRFYDWEARDGLFFDDFDPQRRAVRSVAEYGGIWEPIFRANRSALHAISDAPTVLISSELAASSLEFTARIETLAGKVTGIRTRSDMVWRCRPDGWKIAREHNSSKIVPIAEAERIIAGQAGGS